ncbi:MAG TPA: nuclear transport factor 2 family protein [Trebonia sp.]|nr:nuclear transport factor 2 family protein [Trebonia sp.]
MPGTLISGETARSDYYIDTLAFNEAAKRPEIIATGRNEDEYRRSGGRWQITRSTLIFGWEHEEMGRALQVGPHTPTEYRR